MKSGCSKGERTLASSNNEIDDISSNCKQSNTLSEPGPLVSMVIATTNSDEDTSSSDEEIDIVSVGMCYLNTVFVVYLISLGVGRETHFSLISYFLMYVLIPSLGVDKIALSTVI